jgi:hypothetical protein
MRGFPERAAKFQEKFNEEKMDKVKDNKARHASQLPSPAYRRHPLTLDNPKDVMFERMATVKERIAAFEEKLDADRKKNSR